MCTLSKEGWRTWKSGPIARFAWKNCGGGSPGSKRPGHVAAHGGHEWFDGLRQHPAGRRVSLRYPGRVAFRGRGDGDLHVGLLAARETCRHGRSLVVLDRRGDFYPPAAVRLGIEPEQLLVVHVESAADHDWAMDQVLRSPAVAAALAWPERLDGRTFRRWQLAVEQGGGLGLLLRPMAARADPSWADVRLSVEPQWIL